MMKKWLLLKNSPKSRLGYKNQTLFMTNMTKISYRCLICDQNSRKTISFGAAHTYPYSPCKGVSPRKQSCFVSQSLNEIIHSFVNAQQPLRDTL